MHVNSSITEIQEDLNTINQKYLTALVQHAHVNSKIDEYEMNEKLDTLIKQNSVEQAIIENIEKEVESIDQVVNVIGMMDDNMSEKKRGDCLASQVNSEIHNGRNSLKLYAVFFGILGLLLVYFLNLQHSSHHDAV